MSISINQLRVDKLSIEDYEQLLVAMKAAYPNWQGNYWSMDAIQNLIDQFSDGQVVVKADDKVVGCALSIIVEYERFA